MEQVLGSLGSGKQLIKKEARVNECVYEFLIDTGASHNFVSEQFVSENGLQSEVGKKVKVNVANGAHVITNKYVRCYVDFGDV